METEVADIVLVVSMQMIAKVAGIVLVVSTQKLAAILMAQYLWSTGNYVPGQRWRRFVKTLTYQ